MNSTNVILLCAGSAKRWNNYLGIEKHFSILNGRTIIENTIDLLQQYDTKITIIAREGNQHLFAPFGQNIIVIDDYKSLLEYYKIKSTYSSWNDIGKTIILMGDVWYTSAAIKAILLNEQVVIRFFGRQRKNYYTHCKHGELFAISFFPDHHSKIKSACARLEYNISNREVKISGGWGLYDIVSGLEYLMLGKRVIKGKVLFSNFHQILDVTDDIDTPDDYENIKSALRSKTLDSYCWKKIKDNRLLLHTDFWECFF